MISVCLYFPALLLISFLTVSPCDALLSAVFLILILPHLGSIGVKISHLKISLFCSEPWRKTWVASKCLGWQKFKFPSSRWQHHSISLLLDRIRQTKSCVAWCVLGEHYKIVPSSDLICIFCLSFHCVSVFFMCLCCFSVSIGCGFACACVRMLFCVSLGVPF